MKILAAMSGGVDSSVAALLLKNEGHELIGATMKLYDNETAGLQTKTCCSLDDTDDARRVAMRLGFPYYVFNYEDDFRCEVIDRFVRAYEEGRTPNPCIDCNRFMKFGKLYERARILGCEAVATGHYARVVFEDGRFLLKKGLDRSKDQSYVLACLSQEQLAHLRFPLGDLSKAEVRAIAEGAGLVTASKHESQDICFIPDRDYGAFLERWTGRRDPEGEILDPDGRVIGRHRGAIRYTIGQRRGLGVAAEHPLYVVAKDMEKHTVTVGPESALYSRELTASDFNWLSIPEPDRPLRVTARTRYRQRENEATVWPLEGSRVRLVFDRPQRAITPGQALVLYDGDLVLGGGTIEGVGSSN